MMKTLTTYSLGIMFSLLLMLPATGQAQNFVYMPLDPAFGGSPINYSWLLNSANTQNPYKSGPSFNFNRNPLSNFKQTLQRRVLSQLTRQILQKRFGKIELKKPSNYQFGQFNINIIPGQKGVKINIYDNKTGQQTSVTIPNF